MNLLPSEEERQWLTNALRKILRGTRLLDSAPLVEPTNEWFPEMWSTTAAHGHRLAQRLLYYAGLQKLRPTLSAFEPAEVDEDGMQPWDAGTAGWFAGIDNGRAHFGLHVGQFADPEAAAGVLAHEVAHAWRAHHRLVIDDRDEEEHLTDVTTIALGFGILSTNNTDRYRSSGDARVTTWSVSSVGYLPPQAMAYALALWSGARGKSEERRAIERYLENNQRSFYRAALEEIAERAPAHELLGVAPMATAFVPRPEDFTPTDPHGDEIEEPEYEDPAEVNRGRMVYRKARGSPLTHAYLGALAGFLFGGIAGVTVWGESSNAMTAALVCTVFATVLAIGQSRSSVCSDCGVKASDDRALCTGCGGTLGRRVTERELRRIREDELDARAAASVPYEDCSACAPEQPCAAHRATHRLDRNGWEPETTRGGADDA